MKICTVVGIRKSGKTTTVTGLIRVLKARGYRVGTVKSVFCPEFTVDSPGSNTMRHKEAGADFVCLKGKQEMDILLPPQQDGCLYEHLPADILLLEGEYELSVPRIVCAHKEEDALERISEETIAVAGKLAETAKEAGGCRVYHSMEQIESLADLILQIPDAEFPLHKRPMLEKAAAFCQCGCHKTQKKLENQKKAAGMEKLIAHPEHEGRPHIFLTGKKGIGKSTILRKVAEQLKADVCGYVTLPYEIQGVKKGYFMHSLQPQEEFENDSPVMIRQGKSKKTAIPETFETLGITILRTARETPEKLLILDEIGKAEEEAANFKREVFLTLDLQAAALGILQKSGGDFAQSIAERPDVEVFEVTEENREDLADKILDKIRKQGVAGCRLGE